jgi:hypothetical protein
MSSFGTPTYEDEEHKANGGAAAAGGPPPDAEYIDPNDPLLTSESLTEDLTADAYKMPPPAPDGFWRAKLKIVPIKDAKGAMVPVRTWRHENMNGGLPMYVANVEASLIDLSGKYDGTRIIEQWVKSGVDRRKNVSQMTTITVKAGGAPSAQPATEKSRYEALAKALAGEPEVVVETFWEGSCMSCGEQADKRGEKRPGPFLRGMHRFPQVKDAKGNMEADPIALCSTCRKPCRAQVRIAGFHKLADQKPTRGLA